MAVVIGAADGIAEVVGSEAGAADAAAGMAGVVGIVAVAAAVAAAAAAAAACVVGGAADVGGRQGLVFLISPSVGVPGDLPACPRGLEH